ncbi:hypothetical protein PSTEL_02335 [Paenibacillus stellifer]|uniref:Uncharacterized protein n=1 Tax=Paenibacillus stellifer TaxID=169760 RepID=A0A089LMK6_9BACL|nr:hypothetical protein PSTEL_02335 [Paenibacillus stellifer]
MPLLYQLFPGESGNVWKNNPANRDLSRCLPQLVQVFCERLRITKKYMQKQANQKFLADLI